MNDSTHAQRETLYIVIVSALFSGVISSIEPSPKDTEKGLARSRKVGAYTPDGRS
jgi:hypothetical protein